MSFNVLILCTGNSARSILAEAALNRRGQGRVRAWSAGSFPKGRVHPQALALLERLGHPTESLRSKSWDEFTEPGAPEFNAVITVCDNAAGEVCPVWFGQPLKAHWGVADPADAGMGPEAAPAFERAYAQLDRRVAAFLALPFENLDRAELKARLDTIGHMADPV